LNPSTWSAIRRQTNTLGNFLIGDVTVDPVDRVWGCEVLETTVCPAGEGWLLDTTKFGRLAVREVLALRIGYSGTDFVSNVLRYICEERCVLTVERPAAVLHITTLPTVLETTRDTFIGPRGGRSYYLGTRAAAIAADQPRPSWVRYSRLMYDHLPAQGDDPPCLTTPGDSSAR
jgi:hypothetical protein